MKKTLLIIFICLGYLAAQGQQSNTIHIFAPDPLTVLGQSYSGQDGNADSYFTNAYTATTMHYNTITSTEIMGDRVNIVASEAPAIIDLDDLSASGDLRVTRNDPRFKAYNAYYHADKFIEFLEGYSIVDMPMVNIDPLTDTGLDGGGVEMDGSDIVGVNFVSHYNDPPVGGVHAESVDMAEDAFGIANVVAEIYMIYNLKHDDMLQEAADIINMDMPDIKTGLKDYLSQSYVHSLGATDHLCYNWGGQPSIVNQGDQRATDFSYLSGRDFDPEIFIDAVSSQWLSSTLMAIQGGTSKATCDLWIVNSLAPENLNTVNFMDDDPLENIDNMYQYIWYLYDQALVMQGSGSGQFSPDDMCVIYNEFSLTYGENFWSYRDGPPNLDGDIYIKDNADHVGQEITPGSFTNSPSLWNSYTPSIGAPIHQNPYSTDPAAGSAQFLKIAIDGNFCDLQNLGEVVGDVKYKIYRSVLQLGYQWPMDWNNDNVHNAPEGDLIGTFTVLDDDVTIGGVLQDPLPSFRDDEGNVLFSGDDIPFSNEGNLLIIAIPWIVPDYLNDVYLPNISPKDNSNLGIEFQDAFLVRVESTTFDPIANAEVTNVFMNVKNNNNIAMKTSNIVIASECIGCNGTTPGVLGPNDDDPDDVVIYVDPAPHEPVRPVNPDPTAPEPVRPVYPEFNNFMDYGEVAIVLDEDTHVDWVANGSLGNGFTVNSNNEIIVTHSDFKLRGIPRSVSGGPIRAIGVRYHAANGTTLASRTAFDLVATNLKGDEIGRSHYEVRSGSENSAPRSSSLDLTNTEITIYPNPINDNTLYLNNITQEGNFAIMGLDGQTHIQGRYTKGQKSLDISTLNKGVYFLRFAKGNGEVETKKMIKI